MDKKRKCCHRIKSVFGEKIKIKCDSVCGDQRQDWESNIKKKTLNPLLGSCVNLVQVFLVNVLAVEAVVGLC